MFMTGCEWTTGGGVTDWNTLSASVDFSGNYKAADGGVLVRKFGTGSGTTTNTTYTTNTVSGELLGTGDGTTTAFSGKLAHSPPLKGTLTIVVGGYRINDPGTASAGTVALTVTPADGSSGTLNLDTGVWTLMIASPIALGTQIIGAYQYLSSTSVINSNQGNHGDPIYSMVLYQQGNNVQLIDSCNSKYEGTIGNVATNANPIVAQFYATGYSQGYNVTIAGMLQGTLVGNTFARSMKATFIEEGGYDADINGTGQ